MKTLIRLFIITAIAFFSASKSISTPINGIYSIGSGGDYSTINFALSDITSLGINGSVILNILPGIYTEQVTINPIPGSNSDNTLTLKSHSGNPADVKMLFPGNFILRMNGTSNIIIDGITFSQTNNNFMKIEFQNDCSNIKLINNIFNKEQHITSVIGRDIYGNSNLTNILIEGNIFNPSLEQINFSSALISSNIRIIDNILLSGTATTLLVPQSISLYNCDSVLIEENNITTSFRGGGIGLTDCKSFKIVKNIIKGEGSQLVIAYSGIAYAKSIVANNFFLTSGLTGSGIQLNSSINTSFIFNSIAGDGIDILSSNDISLINNIFTLSGTVMYIINSSVVSDYNNFDDIISTYLFYHSGNYYSNLTDFRKITNLDQHSGTHDINFISSTDLHLTGSSVGNEDLVGIPISYVSDDIDGQPRDILYPYKGADEADVVLPVELSDFTSAVIGNNVKLNWTTSAENNDSGFDVERSNVKGQTSDAWRKIGFIKGNGTATTHNNYEFTDRNLLSGKYNYRLKQIDYNGNFEYHELSDEVVIGVPVKFELAQNYPNPFNPATKINYSTPNTQHIVLRIYDINGKEVSTPVNQLQSAGRYEVTFDGSNLASGQYFYKIEAGNYSEVKSMILIK